MEQDLELINFNINLELSSSYLKRLSISSHDDKLGDAAIERLGRLIRPLAQLFVVNRLLDQIQNGLGQMGIGRRRGSDIAVRPMNGRTDTTTKSGPSPQVTRVHVSPHLTSRHVTPHHGLVALWLKLFDLT